VRLVVGLGIMLGATAAARAVAAERLTAADGFALAADVWSVSGATAGALLLPPCDLDRGALVDLGEGLAALGVAAVAVDLRGLGGSRTKDLDLGTASAEQRRAAEAGFPLDVDSAHARLLALLPQESPVAVLGIGCGGGEALALADRSSGIAALALVSPGGGERHSAVRARLADVPVMVVAAEDDPGAATRARGVYEASAHADSELWILSGTEQGIALLEGEPRLSEQIVAWLADRLTIGP